MKRFLTGFIILTRILTTHAQTWETGLAINKTHLWQSEGFVSKTIRTEGLGVSIMARYQNPAADFFINHNELGFEHSRGEIFIEERQSSGGAGGDYTFLKYSSTSFTLNNYFANFGTLKKGFQVSLGLHYNYKFHTLSDGYFTLQKIKWDAMGNLQFYVTEYSLDGKNNQYIRRFNMGPTIGIAFRPFQVGKLVLRSRYDISTTIFGELNNGMNFDNLRQRFTLGIVWDKKH